MQDSKAVLITKKETMAPKNRGPSKGNGKEKSQGQEQRASSVRSSGTEHREGRAR